MFKVIPTALFSVALAGPVWSQDLPDDAELVDRVTAEIPAWWQITEFREIASSDVGDVSQPRSLVRFEADAGPTVPLFTEVDRMPPFVMLMPTQAADDGRTLYGVMDLRYRAGNWTSSIEIENPVDEMGVPRDMFSTPTLIVGSPKAEAAITDLQMAQEAQAVARFESNLASLRAEHRATTEQLEATQDAEIETMRRDHAATMDRLERDLQQELTDLTAGLEPRIAQARAAHNEALAELAREQEEELESIRADYASQRSALREELNGEIATLEVELEAQIERLETRLESSQRAQELEAAYLESVEAHNEMAITLREAMETAIARRVSLLQALPARYDGGVRCRDADGRTDRSWQLAMEFEDPNPSGMRGRFGIDNSRVTRGNTKSRGTANLLIRSDDLTLPIDARLSFAGARDASHLPPTVDVTISETVVISGNETTNWTIDGESTEVTCVYELS